ncbi:ABC transporter substrate-binding protein [Yinghuangia seranimata]|uniref:ABC transporter substrate-binding protein n=1 Tax=Yinghuangia seranimata TaxID=408067 RepID=UPI00248B7EB0|nr:ABC transporter substrate-binding protein [Yinghuangia seranimata]MDI2129415.1 ABC transporter substrate-binding protein [Yinghuangia seranimata]
MASRPTAHPPTHRRSPGRLAAVAGLLTLALAASACGGDGSGKAGGGNTAPAKSGGTLTMLAVQDSASLDPFRVSNVALADEPRMAALYDPLFVIDPKTRSVTPHLGESLTTADNGATWTMKLRPGVVFSDGTPFDAAAVKLNYDTHANPATRSVHIAVAIGMKTEVVDGLTLKLTPLGAPNPNLDRAIASELTYIMAPSAIAKGPDTYGAEPIGAGPFVLKAWTRASEQDFDRNPTYWQKDKGLPKLDRLVIKNVPDIKQQFNTVKAGQADLFLSSDGRVLDQARKDLNLAEFKTDGGQIVQFNLRKPPFDDLRARKALTLALDPADIPKTLNNGYVPAKSVFTAAGPFADPAVVQPAQNKAEAQRLLDELAAEGKKVDFAYLVPQNPSSIAVAEFMQSRLKEFQNISMRIEPLEIGQYIVKYAVQRDYQATLTQIWAVDPEPMLYSYWQSQSLFNLSGWNNPQADAALAAGRASTDPAVRKQAYAELQKAIVADVPLWAYAESDTGVVYGSKVTGIEHYNAGVFFMDRLGLKA